MKLTAHDAGGSPARWVLVFRRHSKWNWVNRVLWFERYRHVMAFGYVRECDAWVFFDAWCGGTSLGIARGDVATRQIMEWIRDSDTLIMDAKVSTRFRPDPRFLCTAAVGGLVGVHGALLPSRLYRRCILRGAIHGCTHAAAGSAAASPGTDGAEPAGAGHAGRGGV